MMDKIYIPHLLQQRDHTLTVDIATPIPELETLTPVRGQVAITHQGTFLEVKGKAETIITLACHRCLQNYNHRLSLAPQEFIWLQTDPDPGTLPLEREVGMDDLVETLPPQGYFYPLTWLYEQICLALPQRQICDPDCPGVAIPASPELTPASAPVDSRWQALGQLQQQLDQSQGL